MESKIQTLFRISIWNQDDEDYLLTAWSRFKADCASWIRRFKRRLYWVGSIIASHSNASIAIASIVSMRPGTVRLSFHQNALAKSTVRVIDLTSAWFCVPCVSSTEVRQTTRSSLTLWWFARAEISSHDSHDLRNFKKSDNALAFFRLCEHDKMRV